jgi:hypothetical protein
MERIPLTPGKLYALLSAEFRTLRSKQCESCAMPMPYLVHPPYPGAANWAVDDEVAACSECTEIAGKVVERMSGTYDVWDPISVAVAAHPMALRSMRLDRRH